MKRFLQSSLLLLVLAAPIACRHIDDAVETTYQETKASTVLNRYEWFKDANSQLEAKKATQRIKRD